MMNRSAQNDAHRDASLLEVTLENDVTLAQNGDIFAYERLIEKSKNLVTSIALAIVKDVDDSEEVAQQVYISVWQNLRKLNSSSSFLPWIRQSTRYTAYNFLKVNKKSSRVGGDQADQILSELTDPVKSAELALMHKDTKRILQGFIDALPSDDREVVLLYYREEQSSKQVADLLHLSSENVRKKLSRVRKSLKTNLLKQASKLVYTSAPTVGFSTLITSLLTPAAPVAAASLSGVASASNSSWLTKIMMIFGGAILGALLAVLASIWSSNKALQTITEQQHKDRFIKYRNEIIAWIIMWAFIIQAGYTYSDTWVGPVLTYLGFSIGFVILMYRNMMYVRTHGKNKLKAVTLRTRLSICGCLIASVSAGFTGVIAGLIGHGTI